jgi:hypothetical protein
MAMMRLQDSCVRSHAQEEERNNRQGKALFLSRWWLESALQAAHVPLVRLLQGGAGDDE